MRHGVRLAIDPGGTRVGVARSDPAGMLATPVRTLRRGDGDIKEIGALVEELDVCEVIVGYPASLSGDEGPAARKARGYAGALASKLAPVPVRLVDERLTTATAQAQLLGSAGHGGRGRRAGEQRRAVVDQAAATVLLQGALDTERRTGRPPGELVGSPLS
ncbi:Holliday junction resolvase RuvX [Spiractinospora alimapuensis]|uniref:Holliday junction resolvase RuvX n=1 Tax=Spiractinospora alimapuensis TaxID=2820884 RepID=UPI001EEB2449|nr:Holliday junction resolvase RuvX [Spiractinospora alimapuensis]QVQ52067.1 Holliday junction resolvase RuvX [Spiractinospora alimapuensis]